MTKDVSIVPWAAIKEQFQGTLLLGNGASRAVNEGFSYAHIYKKAEELQYITDEVKSV